MAPRDVALPRPPFGCARVWAATCTLLSGVIFRGDGNLRGTLDDVSVVPVFSDPLALNSNVEELIALNACESSKIATADNLYNTH